MTDVLIYTKSYCPFCTRAKALFDNLGVAYEEIDLEQEEDRKEEMVKKAGGRTTVPQIFIGGKHVGGCDDAFALHAEGRLRRMIEGKE